MNDTKTHLLFWKFHLFIPMFLFVIVALLLELSSLDLFLADKIYHLSGDTWLFRNAWITSNLVHDLGRDFVGILAVLLVLMGALSFVMPSLRPYRQGFFYLFVSVLVSGIVINVLKQLTHVDCPWDLIRYGGEQEYIRNFDWTMHRAAHGACFPAGHASAAWAWSGLYYFAYEYEKKWCYPALLGVTIMGLIFGFSQELRGAHFLSHDVWTLGLCWLMATLFYLLFFRKKAFNLCKLI